MPAYDFIYQHLGELAEKTGQQIYLAGFAMFLAILIGVPVGLKIARRQKAKSIVLGIANVFQTIPSLALLVFLLPFLGIGAKPAIITLSIYAFLPIIRNTVTGIEGVMPDMIEAADGLGFTRLQKLWMVELPLALPVMIAGIRTAAAMSVGIATLAAFIGAGGLGDFIYQGLSLNDNRLVLLGAIPAALLALAVDFFIARIEKFIARRRYKHWRSKGMRFRWVAAIVVFVLLIPSAFFVYTQSVSTEPVIRIGSKNFTEQLILGEMMSQIISEKAHIKVVKKFNLGSDLICHRALLKGNIDMYPEYTGTASNPLVYYHAIFAPTTSKHISTRNTIPVIARP